MFSDIPSGILSDLSYGIPPDILSDILSVFSDILFESEIPSGLLSDIPSGILGDI